MNQVISFRLFLTILKVNGRIILIEVLVVFLLMVFLGILLIFQYRKIALLFKLQEYERCRKKIDFFYKFAIYKSNKQYLNLFKAQLLIVEDKFSKAIKILEEINVKRWSKPKYFWLCVIYLKAEDDKKLINYFENFKFYIKAQNNDFDYLNNLVLKKTNQIEKMDEFILQKLKCKFLKDYYQQELEKQKEETK